MTFQRVCLAGTTTGTTWRQEVSQRLQSRGVRPDQIVSLPVFKTVPPSKDRRDPGVIIQDPSTILLFYVCPRVLASPPKDSKVAKLEAELLNPVTMFKIGAFSMGKPQRTAVVFERNFTSNGPAHQSLDEIRRHIVGRYGQPGPPYFETLWQAEDWIVTHLT